MANYPPNIAGVATVVSGEGVIVNNADPANPIVSLTTPVSAADGGTGLVTSGTDATKYLKSNGAGGWTLGTPSGSGSISAVTASSPLSSSGGNTPNISLTGAIPLANNSVAVVASATAISSGGTALIDATVASAWDFPLTENTEIFVSFGTLSASHLSVSTAIVITTDNNKNVLSGSFPSVTNWIGSAPVFPTADVVPTSYLVVLTNIEGNVLGSWQPLT